MPAEGVPETIEITDEAGITASVPLNPRVVCLSAASAETVYALNASHLIVGRTDSCTIPPDLESVPSLGSTAGEVDTEAILATGADLVISGVPPISSDTEKNLKSAGIPVLHYSALYVDTILPMIDDLSRILNKESEADKLEEYIKRYQELIDERVGGIPLEDRPKVYFMSMGSFYQTPAQIVQETSESKWQAKRRLYATIISHNNPPFATSDLYEDYVLLQNLIDEYREAGIQNPDSCSRIKERILAAAQALHFEDDDIDRIHDELYEMKRRIIPKGLHILGEGYEKEDLKRFMEFILRYDREGIKSINRIFAEEVGLDYDSALKDRSSYIPQLAEVDRRCTLLVECCLDKSLDETVEEAIEEAVEDCALSSEKKSELKEALSCGLRLMESYSDNEAEIDNFICGLRGGFIEQGDGGDIIRSPEILPTGRNLTQFDPTRIPTETAFERGEEIAGNTLSKYLEKNGCYPESTGIVLWGFETTKTGGETVGQILSYLGVRIERCRGTWSPKLSAVPLENLGRPRIDCLVNYSGLKTGAFSSPERTALILGSPSEPPGRST